jgi:hypothetical protein
MGIIEIGWTYHWTDSFIFHKGCVPNSDYPEGKLIGNQLCRNFTTPLQDFG